jgi:hypothetical protein
VLGEQAASRKAATKPPLLRYPEHRGATLKSTQLSADEASARTVARPKHPRGAVGRSP